VPINYLNPFGSAAASDGGGLKSRNGFAKVVPQVTAENLVNEKSVWEESGVGKVLVPA